MKRGQVSMFVLMGIIILVIAGFGLYVTFLDASTDPVFQHETFEERAREVVQQCTVDALNSAISETKENARDTVPTVTDNGETAYFLFQQNGYDFINYPVPLGTERIEQSWMANVEECVTSYEEEGFAETVDYYEMTVERSEASIGNNAIDIEHTTTVQWSEGNTTLEESHTEQYEPVQFSQFEDILNDLQNSYGEGFDVDSSNDYCRRTDQNGIKPRYPLNFLTQYDLSNIQLGEQGFLYTKDGVRGYIEPLTAEFYIAC